MITKKTSLMPLVTKTLTLSFVVLMSGVLSANPGTMSTESGGAFEAEASLSGFRRGFDAEAQEEVTAPDQDHCHSPGDQSSPVEGQPNSGGLAPADCTPRERTPREE